MSIDISESINELLFVRDCVIIPNLGGIETSHQSAVIDHVKGQILPPSKKLVFNENLVLNDGVLIDHIAKKSNLSVDRAESVLNDFVDSVKSKLAQKEICFIPGIGRIYQDYEGKLNFLQDSTNFNSTAFGLPTLMFYPVLRAKRQDYKSERKAYVSDTGKHRKRRFAAIPKWAAAGVPLLFAGLLLFSVYSIYQAQKTNTGADEFAAKKVPVENRINQKPSIDNFSLTDHLNTSETEETLEIENPVIESSEIPVEAGTNDMVPELKEMIIIIGAFSKKAGVERRIKEIYELGYSAYQDKKGKLTRVGVLFTYKDDSEIGEMMDLMREEFDERAWVLEK